MTQERGSGKGWGSLIRLLPRRMGLLPKLIVPVVLLFLLFTSLLGFWVAKTTRDTFLEEARSRAESEFQACLKISGVKWADFQKGLENPIMHGQISRLVNQGVVEATAAYLSIYVPLLEATFISAYDGNASYLNSSQEVFGAREPNWSEKMIRELVADGEPTHFLSLVPREVLEFQEIKGVAPLGEEGDALALVAFSPVLDDFGDSIGYLLGFRFLNGDQSLVEELSEFIEGGITIFQGGLRIATNLAGADGASLTGTTLKKEIALEVLERGGEYAGPSEISGLPYQTRYGRLDGRDGSPLGIVAVTIPIQGFIQQAARTRNLIIVLGLLALAVFSGMITLIIRRSLKAVGSILGYMASVSEGNLGRSVEVDTQDELETLATGINDTVFKLKDIVGGVEGSFKLVEDVSARLSEVADSLKEGTEQEEGAVDKLKETTTSLSETMDSVVKEVGSMRDAAQSNISSLVEMSASVDEMSNDSNDLAASAVDTSSAITESSAAISQMAENVSSLSQLVEETSASMSQIDQAVKEIAGYTETTRNMTQELSEEASKRGRVAMGGAMEGMGNIKTLVNALGGTVKNLGTRSKEIGEIIEFISDVADQTSLLALNASILAAQAGEKGRGFSVVADEIRDLSERTNKSANEIEDHIQNIQGEIKQAVNEMDQGLIIVDQGTKDVAKVEEALERIIEGADQTRDLIRKIADQTINQSKGSTEVAGALQDIASRSQELAVSGQQQDETARHIMKVAVEMGERAERMKTTTGEQSRTVKLISGEVRRTAQIADDLSGNAVEAKSAVTVVVEAASVIHEVLEENRERVSTLRESIDLLISQAEQVRGNISVFDLDETAAG